MSGEVMNLRLARKARARQDKAAAAQENRVRHGRTLAERRLEQAEAERAAKALDSARREP